MGCSIELLYGLTARLKKHRTVMVTLVIPSFKWGGASPWTINDVNVLFIREFDLLSASQVGSNKPVVRINDQF